MGFKIEGHYTQQLNLGKANYQSIINSDVIFKGSSLELFEMDFSDEIEYGFVMFACNDPNTGNFIGKFCSFGVYPHEIELECVYLDSGVKIEFNDDILTVGKLKMKYYNFFPGWGNWCWDRFLLKKSDVVRILNYLKKSGKWTCDSALVELSEIWFSDREFTINDLKGTGDDYE